MFVLNVNSRLVSRFFSTMKIPKYHFSLFFWVSELVKTRLERPRPDPVAPIVISSPLLEDLMTTRLEDDHWRF